MNGAPRSVTKTWRPIGPVAAQLTQRPDLVAAERMCRRRAVLLACDVDEAGLEVDLVPAQFGELRHAEAMVCGHANGESIAIAIAPALLGSLGKRLDFVWGEVLTDAQLGIFQSPDTASSRTKRSDLSRADAAPHRSVHCDESGPQT